MSRLKYAAGLLLAPFRIPGLLARAFMAGRLLAAWVAYAHGFAQAPQPADAAKSRPIGKPRKTVSVAYEFDFDPVGRIPVAWDDAALDEASALFFAKAEKDLMKKAPKAFTNNALPARGIALQVYGIGNGRAQAVFSVQAA